MHKLACILLWIGGLNWGILGLGMLMGKMMDWNIVHMILGTLGPVEGIVYLLVGIAAVYELATHKNLCKGCDSKSGGAM